MTHGATNIPRVPHDAVPGRSNNEKMRPVVNSHLTDFSQ
jgi:hypothetical protein